jgi:hypothetical protein
MATCRSQRQAENLPPFGAEMGPDQMSDVVAYVLSIAN